MRVLCVKHGSKYGPEWVIRLRNMVARNLTLEHDFVCLTDDPTGLVGEVDCEPLHRDLPGWWAKINLGRPNQFLGQNLYLDLDVVIRNCIDGMILESKPGKLNAPDDFSYSLRNPKPGLGDDMQRLLGGPGTINSSVLIWNDNELQPIWDDFTVEKMDEVHGDQNWITQALWPDIHLIDPAWICSYKYHEQRGERRHAPIVVFHGDPKVNQLPKSDALYQSWTA